MLCREDCLALCGLSEDEVLATAQHEHIPEMAALEMGNYLVSTPQGERSCLLPKPEQTAREDDGENDESVDGIMQKKDNPVANRRMRMSGLLN